MFDHFDIFRGVFEIGTVPVILRHLPNERLGLEPEGPLPVVAERQSAALRAGFVVNFHHRRRLHIQRRRREHSDRSLFEIELGHFIPAFHLEVDAELHRSGHAAEIEFCRLDGGALGRGAHRGLAPGQITEQIDRMATGVQQSEIRIVEGIELRVARRGQKGGGRIEFRRVEGGGRSLRSDRPNHIVDRAVPEAADEGVGAQKKQPTPFFLRHHRPERADVAVAPLHVADRNAIPGFRRECGQFAGRDG
ncbi:hypothetical protein SDC9_161254 [bioreactor metagenome]|uniref:Uncharacterized protein n=1 Tax=bioreactor metagenome TaxID=1076179 RepID=A0A645FHQ2_9ZZZZ